MSRRKVETCSRINDGNGRLTLGEDGVQRIWKDYFEDQYNLDTKEQIVVHTVVHICHFAGIQRGNYFGGKPIRRTEVDVKVEKLNNGMAAAKVKVIGEMVKGGGNIVVSWI